MPIVHEITHRVRLDAPTLRELARAPADCEVVYLGGELVLSWVEPASEPEAPKPASRGKKKEPEPTPEPVTVDWKRAVAGPGAADLEAAEKAAGPERVASVRAALSIGAGVTLPMIALQDGARYLAALRAPTADELAAAEKTADWKAVRERVGVDLATTPAALTKHDPTLARAYLDALRATTSDRS